MRRNIHAEEVFLPHCHTSLPIPSLGMPQNRGSLTVYMVTEGEASEYMLFLSSSSFSPPPPGDRMEAAGARPHTQRCQS